MTQDNKYNGWTNYATWRVNLEMFDEFDMPEYYQTYMLRTYEFSKFLEEYADEILSADQKGLDNECFALSYARAFMDEVNWYEIANHLIQDYENELNAINENTREDYDENTK